MKKWFWVVVIIIILIILAIGVFIFQKSKNNTGNQNSNFNQNTNQDQVKKEDRLMQVYNGTAQDLTLENGILSFLDTDKGKIIKFEDGQAKEFADFTNINKVFWGPDGSFLAQIKNGKTISSKINYKNNHYDFPFQISNSCWLDQDYFISSISSAEDTALWQNKADQPKNGSKIATIPGKTLRLVANSKKSLAALQEVTSPEELTGFKIFLVNPATKVATDFGQKASYWTLASWSTDGSKLAYIDGAKLKVTDNKNQEKDILPQEENLNFVWISQNELLVIQSKSEKGEIEVVKINTDSLNKTSLLTTSKIKEFDTEENVIFNQSKNEFYLMSQTDGKNSAIWKIKI